MLFLSVLGLFGDDVVIVLGLACVVGFLIDIHLLLLLRRLLLQPRGQCKLILRRCELEVKINRRLLEFVEFNGLQNRIL